jgi:hypothetical protein
MKTLVLLFCLAFYAPNLVQAQAVPPEIVAYENATYPLHPAALKEKPDMPSPYRAADGSEYVVGIASNGEYMIFNVTVENREDLEDVWYTQGRQLVVDTADFPTLAATGLHSEEELAQTRAITGRSVEEISSIGRPEQISGEGFLAWDEDILSVLIGDNRLVQRLGMTHAELAKPLFHVSNVIQALMSDSVHVKRGDEQAILYNDRKINLKFWGAKGWQESIFDDEILGYWEIEIGRALDENELAFLSNQDTDLSEEAYSRMIKRLSYMHIGEMVAYYIMRYGFYEGHTSYRADPIAIASIFGLRSINEINEAFGSDLHAALSSHHTSENTTKSSWDEGK